MPFLYTGSRYLFSCANIQSNYKCYTVILQTEQIGTAYAYVANMLNHQAEDLES